MQFEHAIQIEASPTTVWNFLWDVERLARCIPGCEQANVIIPHKHYTAQITDKVGPLKLKMPLDLVVESAEEGRRLHVVGHGRDPALGSNAHLDIRAELGPGERGSTLQLAVEATVSGKIAGLGAGLFKRKFEDIMSKFGQRVKEAIEGEQLAAAQG